MRLPEEIREIAREYRQDVLIEKHESYFPWKYEHREMVAVPIGNNHVLLPYDEDELPKIEILYSFSNTENTVITVFLTDRRFDKEGYHYVAIAEKIPNRDIFITTFFHNTHRLISFLEEKQT
jgi:hypothetical protein